MAFEDYSKMERGLMRSIGDRAALDCIDVANQAADQVIAMGLDLPKQNNALALTSLLIGERMVMEPGT